jgi:hypothetical protein
MVLAQDLLVGAQQQLGAFLLKVAVVETFVPREPLVEQ